MLEFIDASVGDPGFAEIQFRELGQPLQMGQAGVADIGAVEMQSCELGHPFEMLQSGVADLRSGQTYLHTT